jgi:TolB protein
VWHPFWARDGRRIYFGQGELRSVSVSDGSTRVEVPDAIASDVSPDGRTLAVWRMTVENGLRMWTLWFGADAASLRRYEAAPVFRNGTVPTVVRFSPDGSKILLWVAGEKPSIGLMPFPPRPSDPPKRVFADSVGEVAGADWMPDSLHVVLSVNGGLWIGDIETGEVRTLLTSTASLVWPVVSPAGDRLLFTEDRSDLDVVQLSLSGGPRSVVVGSIRNDGSATWSPDGRRLAYVTDRRGSDEVWLRTGDESSDRPFLTARDFPGPRFGRIMSVRYSPDGERMSLATLSSEPGGPFLVRLWIVPARGGTPRLLESEHAHAQRATWSPDGRELAVKDSPDDSVWALDVDSSRPPRRILKRPDVHVWHLEWSPTGDLIAGVGLIDPGRVPRTVVFAPDGTGLRTFPELSQVALLWSRDGRTLYGVTDIDGSTVLRALDVASGQVRTVANYGARLALTEPINDSLQFTLTPDGTGFVATVYNNRSDIWLLDGLSAPAQRRWSVW